MKENTQKTIGGLRQKRIRKPWVTEEMINRMEERRKWKRVNTEQGRTVYKALNNQIKREKNKARDQWWKRLYRKWRK